MKDSKEIFYVNIHSSHDLRRGILETSKQVIESLHRHEKFKKTRAERIKAVEELIIIFREINEVAGQLNIDLPKIKLPQSKRVVPEEPQPEKKDKKDDDELKKLESAIAQIESRLGSIE